MHVKTHANVDYCGNLIWYKLLQACNVQRDLIIQVLSIFTWLFYGNFACMEMSFAVNNQNYWSISVEKLNSRARCLKITDKVSINIASKVNSVYIFSVKSHWKCQKWTIWRVFGNRSLWSNSVTRLLIEQKLAENAKIQKFKCDIMSNFLTMPCMLHRFISFLNMFASLLNLINLSKSLPKLFASLLNHFSNGFLT